MEQVTTPAIEPLAQIPLVPDQPPDIDYTLLAEFEAFQKKKAETLAEYNEIETELNNTWFESEINRIDQLESAWIAAGVSRLDAERTASRLRKQIYKDEFNYRYDMVQSTTTMFADNFKQLADMGGKHAEEYFKMWQAFKVLETTMATYSMAVKAYESLVWIPVAGPALATAAAAAATAFGMAQVAAITAMEPPSYDQGGVSTTPGIYYSGVPEAHVPLQSGKIPVQLNGGGQQSSVTIKMENPVFQDVATQRQVFAQIAEVITKRVAPKAILDNYNNDGAMRRMVGR
jgi:hypothetical protein